MDKMIPHWYETWFNSPYYHLLYNNRNQEEAKVFIENLTRWLEVPQGANILDLACGRGRHAHLLANMGYHVVGADLSEKSIEYAKAHYQGPFLDFYLQDMRLPFRINYFDYVFNFFTSFGYFKNFKENESVISSIKKGLKKGGRAMIDFMNAEKAINEMISHENKTIDQVDFYIRREVVNGFIYKTIKVDDGKKVSIFREEVQILKPAHFYQMIQDEGFKLVKEFGDYQLNSFDVTNSDRYILIIEKQ